MKRRSHFQTVASVILLLMAFSLFPLNGYAEQVQAKLTYIASGAVYINAGSISGIAKGDTGQIQHNGTTIARIEVLFVAEKSASCKVIDKTSEPKEGDTAILEVHPLAVSNGKDTTKTVAIEKPSQPTKALSKKSKSTRLSGQIAAQAFIMDDRQSSSRSYLQPSLLINGRLENIAETYHSFSLLMRSRYTDQQLKSSGSSSSEWNSRVYEACLSYDNPASRFQYSLGRIRSNRISGIGDLDGVSVGYHVSDQISWGAFGGTQPDLRTSEIETQTTKFGLFSGYETDKISALHLNATLALAGEYHQGIVSREFIYEQINLTTDSRFSVYQSGELNINRGWKKNAEGKSLELSSLMLNLRYTPTSILTATINYDNRTNIRTFETRAVPDTLFDNELQQGLQAGLECRPVQSVTVDASGGMRKKTNESQTTKTSSLGLMARNLLQSEIFATLRINTFRNTYSSGFQPSLNLSRTLLPSLDGALQIGQDHYDLKLAETKVRSNWLKVSANYMITRSFFTSAYTEFYRGGNLNSNRFYVELGIRL
jgi:hypothetical protein